MASISGAVYRGADATITLTITNANGTARNITNDALTFTAKYNAGDESETPIITKTVGSGITKTNPTGGIATVAISETDFDEVAKTTTLSAAVKVVDSVNYTSIEAMDLQVVVTAGG